VSRVEAEPGVAARLCREDLPVIDEAGMVDDTARALFRLADETKALVERRS
jgi:hypothetical protein